MKITAGTLFLTVAVSLDSIELISSVNPARTTLWRLFPEYRQTGYLPPVELNTNHEIIRTATFTEVGNHILHIPAHDPPFLARGNVIFAWRGDHRNFAIDWQGDNIEPLWQLFEPTLQPKCWVFDTIGNRWVTLDQNEFHKLGFHFNWLLVQVQQHTALTYRRTTRDPVVDRQAHHAAYLRANEAIDMLQATQAEQIYNDETTVAISAMFITTRYQEAYKRVFQEIVRRSG